MPEQLAIPETEQPQPITKSVPAGEKPASAEEAATPPTGATPDPVGEKPTQPTPDDEIRRNRRRAETAYRKLAEQKGRADLLEKRIAELEKPKELVDPGEPKFEQFDDIEKYADAKAKYQSEKILKANETKRRTDTQRAQQEELVRGWDARAERGAAKYDDWEEVVGELKPTTPWATAIMDADNSDDIAHYLGKNIEEAKKIAALSPLGQIRAIGRIEAKLLAEPVKPATPSKAPAPITPVSGAATIVSDVPSDKDDLRTWINKRNKQVHGKR